MKKVSEYALCLLTLLALIHGKASAQTSVLPVQKDSACMITAAPLLFTAGDTLTIACDSVYLINKYRYQLYRQLHRNAIWQDQPCDELIHTYEQTLQASDEAFQQLLVKYRQSDALSRQLIDKSQASLQQVDHTLNQTCNTLTLANQNLEQARDMLRQERRKSLLQKLSIGLAGAGLGILLGVGLGH